MRRGVLSRAATLVGGLAILAACVVYASTELRLRRVYRVPPTRVEVRAGADAISRGRHLVRVVAQCTNCHGEDLGGQQFGEDLWFGRLFAPNLTAGRGGVGSHTDEELARSIRYGVGRDGRPLLVMPAQYLRSLSEADLGTIVAYLRSLPPLDREVPPPRVGPLSRLFLFLGWVPDVVPAEMLAAAGPPPPAPPEGVTVEYGRYLVDAAGCRVCHGAELIGGLHPLALPGEPEPPNLTPAGPLRSWSERDFMRTLRTGVRPDGSRLDDAFMPWQRIGQMSDSELRAIWRYLRSLPPQRSG